MPASAGKIARHSAYARFLHWAGGLCFILGLLSGLGLFLKPQFGWLLPMFGGRKLAEELHPWFGLGFVFFFIFQFFSWLPRMRWKPADREFLRHVLAHVRHPNAPAPAETGFFNGGQKAYFWTVAASAAIFLETGIVYWFPKYFPKGLYAAFRYTHRAAGIVMAVALLAHIFKATIGEPGTFRSMLGGKVTEEWARLRRPRWHRDLRGAAGDVPSGAPPVPDPINESIP